MASSGERWTRVYAAGGRAPAYHECHGGRFRATRRSRGRGWRVVDTASGAFEDVRRFRECDNLVRIVLCKPLVGECRIAVLRRLDGEDVAEGVVVVDRATGRLWTRSSVGLEEDMRLLALLEPT